MQGVGRLDVQVLFDFTQRATDKVKTRFNAETAAGLIVAATSDWPGSLSEFPPEGKIIGVICVSCHLVKFRLLPGVYDIKLYRTIIGTWQAEFIHENGEPVSYIPVNITETRESYPVPRAFITFSSPGVIICWDNT